MREGGVAPEDLVGAIADELANWARPAIVPVWNATGVVLHTNLGRAPWHADAITAAGAVAAGWSSVEIDLATGRRGGRAAGLVARLQRLTGCEDALVVNNNAAAVLLALTALGAGREVVVSRGELVEIGGAFRVPDVVASGGATLREVGTTNRTRTADYIRATGPGTALWLRVHPSNFRIVGFTERPALSALAQAAKAAGVPLVDDVGSGHLYGIPGEPGLRETLAAGVDLACCSGDKLLGGPQAGLILGRATLVEALRKHPLYRALRVDKVTLAALDATLAVWERGERPPAANALALTAAELAGLAAALAKELANRGVPNTVIASDGLSGGGSMPETPLPGWAVSIPSPDVEGVSRRLRTAPKPIVARVSDHAIVLDVRTLSSADFAAVADEVAAAMAGR